MHRGWGSGLKGLRGPFLSDEDGMAVFPFHMTFYRFLSALLIALCPKVSELHARAQT